VPDVFIPFSWLDRSVDPLLFRQLHPKSPAMNSEDATRLRQVPICRCHDPSQQEPLCHGRPLGVDIGRISCQLTRKLMTPFIKVYLRGLWIDPGLMVAE
jgi:hypothetical protein